MLFYHECHTLLVIAASLRFRSLQTFLITAVLKIHINSFIDKCSFSLTFQLRQNRVIHKTIIDWFSLQRSNKNIKNPFAET